MEKKKKYNLTLQIDKKKYRTEGNTVVSCINKLKIPRLITYKGIITVRHGKRKAERLLNTWQMRRLFSNQEIFKQVMAKNITMFLK